MSASIVSIPGSPAMLNTLPDQQERVIALLSTGASITEAAAEAGVHRNSVQYWRRSSQQFRAAFAHAQYDRALAHREHAEALADTAINTVRELLTSKDASASVRLRAALAIIETAITPPQEAPFSHWDPRPDPDQPKPSLVQNHMHKDAQTPLTTYRRDEPKTGRNDDCSCGSGLKFKRCCLNKPAARAILEVDRSVPAS